MLILAHDKQCSPTHYGSNISSQQSPPTLPLYEQCTASANTAGQEDGREMVEATNQTPGIKHHKREQRREKMNKNDVGEEEEERGHVKVQMIKE